MHASGDNCHPVQQHPNTEAQRELLVRLWSAMYAATPAFLLPATMSQGEILRIRRPHDYNPTAAKALGPSEPSPYINLALLSVGGRAGGRRLCGAHQRVGPARGTGGGPGGAAGSSQCQQ